MEGEGGSGNFGQIPKFDRFLVWMASLTGFTQLYAHITYIGKSFSRPKMYVSVDNILRSEITRPS